MPPDDRTPLRLRLSAGDLSRRFLSDAQSHVDLAALAERSQLGSELTALYGRSVLLAMTSQLAAALAMIELDGIARRIVLCPPGVPSEHRTAIAAAAAVDVTLSDDVAPRLDLARPTIAGEPQRTEWVLLTSGTTGMPKLVVHTAATLGGPPRPRAERVWSTFYDVRRYGGIAIFFRALLGGGSLVLSEASEEVGAFLQRLASRGVTHISGTPSHWRRALMSPGARGFAPLYVRLSGEIADQPILDQLRAFWPATALAHAFASTEAGLAFEVNDGLAGFPAALVDDAAGIARLKIAEASLRIRSPYTAERYLGDTSDALAAADGFIDTRDLVERRGERYYFVGRSDGVINVGGVKIHPEKVEAIINAHPSVAMSLVKARRSPLTGAVVVADIVCRTTPARGGLADDILSFCRARLLRHEVPVSLRFVEQLDAGPNGKLRRHA